MGAIRRLEPTDLPAAVRICNAEIARGGSTWGPAELTADQLGARLSGGPRPLESWVWEDTPGELAGWGALTSHTQRDIYDTIAEVALFVDEPKRRHGIGRELAQHALARARALELRALVVLVQPTPAFLIAWCVRQGFRNVGWLKGVVPVGAEWRDTLVFQRTLT
ncbi:GNAT family N-acetyltransferase [Myxococcus faecalis]|uniref:GNAT family N-acetyltransferase n=1 Tax=Myxococcus TaxID=32 RepID=UPI001CBF84CA|nr:MULTISPECIES: GNAT family N-acetyltransferase [unclassified Myxococcus]MBZ4397240.1 GNAT family N-acetyltransferase [Myxococcus sp. AS-1-15]MBZ4410794.1 GNAT family N-acetyltransferase [Myxococcus sp. XM-1-1-1]BDT34468.1 GNAT family N-acetyltransferase [Myxococcus sp. MH1]